MARFAYSTAIVLAVLATGCAGKLGAEDIQKFKDASLTGGGGGGRETGCSLNIDVETAIFADKCGACHGAVPAGNKLDLTSADVFTRLVGKASSCGALALVEPTAPAAGVLLDKLTTAPPCGSRMPFAAAALSDAEIECVASWIDEKLAGGTP